MIVVKVKPQSDKKTKTIESEYTKTADNAGSKKNSPAFTIQKIEPNDPFKLRKKTILILLLIILLLISIPTGVVLTTIFGKFNYVDLGGTYEESDLISAYNKLELTLSDSKDYYIGLRALEAAELWQETPMSSKNNLANKASTSPLVSNYEDYTWLYDDFQQITIELKENEFAAILADIAPTAFFTEQIQVRFNKETIELAGKLHFKDALATLYKDDAPIIPLPAFTNINFHIIMKMNIYENQLNLTLESLKLGIIPITTAVSLEQDAVYLERIYRMIPGLIIHSANLTKHGTLRLTMTCPASMNLLVKDKSNS